MIGATTRADQERPEMYAAGVERYMEQLQAAARDEWVTYHRHMASLHRRLADDHERTAAELTRRIPQ